MADFDLNSITESNLSPEQALTLVTFLNSGGPNAESVKARLYPDLITRIAGLFFGDAPGWTSHLTPVHQPLRCWLDAADFSRYTEFDEYNKQLAKVSKSEIVEPQKSQVVNWLKRFSDLDRVKLANSLIIMFRPFDPHEEDKDRLKFSLLFFDDIHDKMSTSLFIRQALLPLSTQRILSSNGFAMPSEASLRLPGGLFADMVLQVLSDRFRDKQKRQLQTGKEPLPFLPQSGSSSYASIQESSGRRGLHVDSRALFLMLFFNYQVSSTRWKEDLRRRLFEEKSKMIPEFGFAEYPLLYQDLDHVFEFRPYQTMLFEMLGVHLPTHLPWDPPDHKPPHPESKLFLALLISSWLMRNPPYQKKMVPSHVVHHVGGLSSIRQTVVRTSTAQSPSSRPQSRLFDEPGVFGPDSIGSTNLLPDKNLFSVVDKTMSPSRGLQPQNIILAPDPYTPSPNTYLPPTLDLLISVSVAITLQLCDKEFPEEIACIESKEVPKLRSGGRPVLDIAGLSASGLAKRATEKDFFLNQEIDKQLQKNSRVRGAYPRSFPGTVAIPAIWEQLHAPLFHFFRNHLLQLDVLSDPVLFATLADTWCMVLTPWRARPRWKIKTRNLLEPNSRTRYFSYNEEVSRQLEESVKEKRRLLSTKTRSSLDRLDTVYLKEEDVEVAKKNARSSLLYAAKLKSTRDFEGGVYENMFKETLSESEKLTQKAYTLDDWRPWIRLHFLFYVHLLPIFLRQLSLTTFSSTPPILLSSLERVLDIFEPQLVDELRRCEDDWRLLFSQQVSQSALIDSDRETTARRIQLLAHRNMLQLPPEVNPVELVDSSLKSASATSLVDITEGASAVIEKLREALKSRRLEKPPPVSIPEACSILMNVPCDSKGEVPLLEHLSYWHGVEAFWADIFRIFTHICSWILVAMTLLQRDEVHINEGGMYACSCRPCTWARSFAEKIIRPVEFIAQIILVSWTQFNVWFFSAKSSIKAISTSVFDVSKSIGIDLVSTKKDVNKKDTLTVTPVIRDGTFLIERLTLSIDRLLILQSRSAVEIASRLEAEPITACDLRNYRKKSLLVQLIEFTQSPLLFLTKPGKEVYFIQQTQEDSVLPGWWESSVLISLTALVSSLPTRLFGQRIGSVERNHLRFLADVRILFLVIAWVLIVWFLGRFVGFWQMSYFMVLTVLLRHMLLIDIINSFQQLVAFLFGVCVVYLWAVGQVNFSAAIGVLGVLSLIKLFA